MSIPQPDDNSERPYDEIIDLIVNYVYDYEVVSKPALARSKLALIDSPGRRHRELGQEQGMHRPRQAYPGRGQPQSPGGFDYRGQAIP
ncbi:hypothetical protein PG995_014772 [Apiospora arundinis]